ncbi:MAG: hypothetical protein ACE14S_08625 [Candidatus Bathyarchaeia archaeon]
MPASDRSNKYLLQRKADVGKITVRPTGRLPVIKCVCGTEILVLPDLKEMSKAIDRHALEHLETERRAKRDEAVDDVWRLLIKQLLKKADEISRC